MEGWLHGRPSRALPSLGEFEGELPSAEFGEWIDVRLQMATNLCVVY